MNDGSGANRTTELRGAAVGPLDQAFLAAPVSAGVVRASLRARLAVWNLSCRTGDVELIAGELLANAVRYAPYREMRVQFWREEAGLLLRVWDCANALPVVRPLGPVDVSPDAAALNVGHDDGTGGWGLPIVEALSLRCGVERTRPHGKWVWSLCAC